MRTLALGALFALAAVSRPAAADPPITFWAKGPTIDVASSKVVTMSHAPGKVKLGKGCAGSAGSFDR